jgi:hypothetical protein
LVSLIVRQLEPRPLLVRQSRACGALLNEIEAYAAVAAFYDGVVERLRASQDVITAGAGQRVPAAGSRYNPNRSVVIEVAPPPRVRRSSRPT